MIPVPSYQLIPFLEWLHQRGFADSIGRLDHERLESLAREFLQTCGLEGWSLPRDLAAMMRLFENCSMISEPDLRSQMEHFVSCGRCLEHVGSARGQVPRSDGRRSLKRKSELHPLLARFVNDRRSAELNARIGIVARELGGDDPRHAFHSMMRSVGPELHSQFERFLAESLDSKPSLVSKFESACRRRAKEVRDDSVENAGDGSDGMSSIKVGTPPGQAASRLAISARIAFDGDFYGQETNVDASLFLLMSRFRGNHEDLARAIAFVDHLHARYPKLRIPGNMPVDELQFEAREFAAGAGYPDPRTFAKQVVGWLYGQGPGGLLERLAGVIARIMGGTRPSSVERLVGAAQRNPLDRYGNIRFHALFLFQSADNFPSFLHDRWKDLHYLTGDDLDIYYTSRDVATRISGDQIAKEIGIRSARATDVPGIVIWERSLVEGEVVALGSLDHDGIMKVMREIVQAIRDGCTLKDVVERGQGQARKLRQTKIVADAGQSGIVVIDSEINMNGSNIVGGNAIINIDSTLNNVKQIIQGAPEMSAEHKRHLEELVGCLRSELEQLKASHGDRSAEIAEALHKMLGHASRPAKQVDQGLLSVSIKRFKDAVDLVADVAPKLVSVAWTIASVLQPPATA
jgi:hypothetical protein